MVEKPKRRKAIPKLTRALVALRQHGICACGCGERLMPGFHIDHQPALELRMWDDVAQDTIPPANDMDYMFGLIPLHHLKKTTHPRGPHTTLDSDIHAIAKGRRIRGEVKEKPKTDWPKRPMRGAYQRRVRDINDA